MSKTIYCISGLGADEKIFANFHLDGYELKHIPWMRPDKTETIDAYARRMAAVIKEDNPILLGVSFGGMVAIEIARQLPVQKLILVSSIKCSDEMPGWMKLAGRLKLNRLIPKQSYKMAGAIGDFRLGVTNKEERKLVRAYRLAADPVYVQWAINQIINWKNKWIPEQAVHIHGDRDSIFPVRKIKNASIIKNATHLLIYNRAQEVTELIRKELGK
jgi:pimeloyl-ACP methyl ester carboxylesterase